MGNIAHAITIEDLRQLALRYLPDFISGFVETGGGSGEGLRRNIDGFLHYCFVTRSLVDVTQLDTTRSILGRPFSLPFGISAVGNLGLFRRGAEEMLAEVARDANIPFMLSGCSTSSIETISRIAPDQTWYQLYAVKDIQITEHVIARVHDAGVQVLVLTVDYPVKNRNQAGQRSGVSFTTGADWSRWHSILWDVFRHPAWAYDFVRAGGMPKMEGWAPYAPPGSGAVAIAKFFGSIWPPNLLWGDLERIRAAWPGKLVVKGLCHPADILRAAELGVDAVTVSNHGGNKLDCMPASIDLLAFAKAIVGDRIPLFVDGGIRRGEDILKALALGAQFCFFGRPTLYGVAAGGRAGAARAIDILKSELAYTQAMLGCATYRELGRELLFRSASPLGLMEDIDPIGAGDKPGELRRPPVTLAKA